MTTARAGASTPAKLVIERHIHPGAEASFTVWADALVRLARAHPAHEGSSVLTTADGDAFVLVRFASQDALDAWHTSVAVRAHLASGDLHSRATEPPQVRSGFETWFTLPGRRAMVPPRWKIALITWCALLPQVLILGTLVPAGVPRILSVMITTAIPVAMLTWVVMPRLTRWLHRWLFTSS